MAAWIEFAGKNDKRDAWDKRDKWALSREARSVRIGTRIERSASLGMDDRLSVAVAMQGKGGVDLEDEFGGEF